MFEAALVDIVMQAELGQPEWYVTSVPDTVGSQNDMWQACQTQSEARMICDKRTRHSREPEWYVMTSRSWSRRPIHLFNYYVHIFYHFHYLNTKMIIPVFLPKCFSIQPLEINLFGFPWRCPLKTCLCIEAYHFHYLNTKMIIPVFLPKCFFSQPLEINLFGFLHFHHFKCKNSLFYVKVFLPLQVKFSAISTGTKLIM